eukprot:339555_1
MSNATGWMNLNLSSTIMNPFLTSDVIQTTHLIFDSKSIQNQCPNFILRTPYSVVFLGSIITMYFTTLLWLKDNSDENDIDSLKKLICPCFKFKPLYTSTDDSSHKKRQIHCNLIKIIKNTFMLLVMMYIVVAFWLNIIVDFQTLFKNGNDGKWICYVTIFSSSPNFKHLFCYLIFSIPLYLTAEQGEFSRFRHRFSLILVTIPGTILYFIPFMYNIMVFIIFICIGLSVFCGIPMILLTGGDYSYLAVIPEACLSLCGDCCGVRYSGDIVDANCYCMGYGDCCKKIVIITLLLGIISAFIIFHIWIGDQSVCIIHNMNDCNWRLDWGQYSDSAKESVEG